MNQHACVVVGVSAFICSCAGGAAGASSTTTKHGLPDWLSKLERNVVVVASAFEGEAYDEPAKAGAGIIVSVTDDDVTILTATHLLKPTQGTLSSVVLRFSTAPEFEIDDAASVPVVHLRDELSVITASVGPRTASILRRKVNPVKLGAPADVLRDRESAWFTGRCGAERLHSFRLPALTVRPSEQDFSVSGEKIPPGCSGGSVFAHGRLIGIMQTTDSSTGHATSVENVLRQLRERQPHDDANRNLLEPFGVVAFQHVPYRATYQIDGGPLLPLMPENMVPAGNSTLTVRSNEANDDFATVPLALNADQRLACRTDFATSVTKFRGRYRYYLLGGSLLIAALGGGFLALAEMANDEFDATWSRSDLDRNQLYSDLALGTLIGGAAAVSLTAVFAFAGDAYEESTVQCE